MALLDDLLKQVTSGNAPAADVHAAYDRVAPAVPRGELADGLAHAFNSDQTPPFDAHHPRLVKAIGAGALALLMSRISAGRR